MWTKGDPTIISKAKEIASLVAGLSPVEKTSYSVSRLIRDLAGQFDNRLHDSDAGLERELSTAIAQRLNRPTAGAYIPTRLMAAGLDTKTNAAGKYTVATEVRDLIELLRNRTRVIQMGATVLSGLSSDVQFPVELTGSSGSWVAENPGSDVSASDATFGARTLSPKMFSSTTSFSRKLLAQSSIDVEVFVRNDLAAAHSLALDAAAINGTGDNNQPLGLLGVSGVGSVAMGAAGGVPGYSSMVDLETKVASANGDEAGMAFLTTPGIRGLLRKTALFTNTALPVWEGSTTPGVGSVAGYPARVSNQVPSTLVKGASGSICHAIVFGYWPSLIIGEFGTLEVLVDPYQQKRQGLIECTSYGMYDICIRQPGNFAAIQDATLS